MDSNPFALNNTESKSSLDNDSVNDKSQFPTGDEIVTESCSVSVFTADDIEDL